jgi:hypothetical protein
MAWICPFVSGRLGFTRRFDMTVSMSILRETDGPLRDQAI